VNTLQVTQQVKNIQSHGSLSRGGIAAKNYLLHMQIKKFTNHYTVMVVQLLFNIIISVISWRSVLLVEETGVPVENQ